MLMSLFFRYVNISAYRVSARRRTCTKGQTLTDAALHQGLPLHAPTSGTVKRLNNDLCRMLQVSRTSYCDYADGEYSGENVSLA